MLRSFLFLLPVLALAAPAVAQNGAAEGPTAAELARWDSAADAGRVAGRVAAGERPVGDRFVLAVIGGLPVGYFGVVAGGERVQAGLARGGVVLVGSAALVGRTAPPPELVERAALHGPAYEDAFRRAYADRLLSRRSSAALRGGALGAAAGVALVFLLLPAT